MQPFVALLLALWVPMAAGSGAADLVQQGQERFRARLSTVPIDLAMEATIAGHGSVTATLLGDTLTVVGDFTGLKSSATTAKLHISPIKGMRGPAMADLTVKEGTRGSISGSVQLTPQQVDDLRNSRLYVQLHSEKAPDGNLWGWLLPQERRQ